MGNMSPFPPQFPPLKGRVRVGMGFLLRNILPKKLFANLDTGNLMYILCCEMSGK